MHLPPACDLNRSLRDSQLYQGWFSYLRHELKTPVNAILGYSEMILEECEDLGDEASRDALQEVHDLGKRVLSHINQLLSIEDLSAEEIETKACHLSQSLRLELHPPLHSLVYLVEVLLEEPALEPFTEDLDRILYASRDLLSQTQSVVDVSELELAEQLEQFQDTQPLGTSLPEPPSAPKAITGHILVQYSGQILGSAGRRLKKATHRCKVQKSVITLHRWIALPQF